MLQSLRSTRMCFINSLDDVMQMTFRFQLLVTWLSPHGSVAFFYPIWCKISLSGPKFFIFLKFKMAVAAILDFQFMWIWPFRRVDSVVFVFCKFGSNICYSRWYWCTYASDNYLMMVFVFCNKFDDITQITFRFRLLITQSSPYGCGASCHVIICNISSSSRKRLTFFSQLDIQFMCIWPFLRVGSVVFVFCTKCCSNIRYSRSDRRTCASDIHLMTSRELTSGFDFWSRGHLRMAVVHLPI